MASWSNRGATHPPRSTPPLRSSSGPPSPCITPSTVTIVVVVSFIVGSLLVDFSLVWSSFGRTGPHRSHRSWHGPCHRALPTYCLLPLGESRGSGGTPRSCAVGVVVVPPPVGRRLRVVLGRVLPVLLAPQRGHVQVAPSGAHGLVAAAVDEIGAIDLVTLADERVVPVPLVDAEVLVPVVGDRVPGDVLPPVALLQLLELGLRCARGERERHIPRVQVGGVGDLVREEGAAHARPLGVRVATLRVRVGGDLRPVEGAVDDQLTAALKQVGKRGRPIRALEAVLLLDRHPRHPAALGRERVAGSGVLLLLDEQFLAGDLPLLGGDDGGCVHFAPSSLSYSTTTSMKRRRPSAARTPGRS